MPRSGLMYLSVTCLVLWVETASSSGAEAVAGSVNGPRRSYDSSTPEQRPFVAAPVAGPYGR